MPTNFVLHQLPKVAQNSSKTRLLAMPKCTTTTQDTSTRAYSLLPNDFDAVKSYLRQVLDLKWFQTCGNSSKPWKQGKADGSVWVLWERFKPSPQWAALTTRDNDLALLHHLNKGLLLKDPLHLHGHSKFRKGTDLWSINSVTPETTTEGSLGRQFSKHLFKQCFITAQDQKLRADQEFYTGQA